MSPHSQQSLWIVAIRTNSSLFRVSLVSVLLVAFSARAADSEASGPLEPPADPQTNAAKLFEEAMNDYDREDISSAIEKLQKAQLIAPHPKVVYNLAQFLELVGHRADAYRHFQQYLVLAGDQVDEPRRSAVQAKLSELESRLGRLRVETRPAGATLLVDDKPFQTSSEWLIDAGLHSIRATAPSFQPAELTVTVGAGERQQVLVNLAPAIDLRPVPRSRDVIAESRRQPLSHPVPDVPPRAASHPWATVLLGSGSALLAGSITAHLARSARNDDWEKTALRLDAVPASARSDAYWAARADNANLARSIRHLDGLRLGLLVGAGTLFVAGAGVWLTSTPSRDATALAYRHSW
jgi:hypothetical protein